EWCDLLSNEYLNYVPRHWLQYSPPTCDTHFVFAILYTIIAAIGLVGNGLILWLFVSRKRLQTPTIMLSTNVALSDLLMNLKIPFVIYNSFNCRPSIGVTGCQLYGFIGGFAGTATIASITAVTCERYYTISRSAKCAIHPLSFKKSISIIIAIWLYALTFSLPPLLGIVNRYVPEGFLTTCSFDYLSEDLASKTFVFVFFVAAYVIPLCLIIFSYISIYAKTVRSAKLIRRYQKEVLNSNAAEIVKRSYALTKLKLGKTTLCLIILWTLAWTPYAMVALFGLFGDRKYLSPTLSMIPALFCKCASIIDPFVYGTSNSKFRNEIKCLLKSRRETSETFNSSWKSSRTTSQSSSSKSIRFSKRIESKRETFV
ncbi:opsin: ultraviolet-sensitive-like protein, partial [Leptotrombidium deliense]